MCRIRRPSILIFCFRDDLSAFRGPLFRDTASLELCILLTGYFYSFHTYVTFFTHFTLHLLCIYKSSTRGIFFHPWWCRWSAKAWILVFTFKQQLNASIELFIYFLFYMFTKTLNRLGLGCWPWPEQIYFIGCSLLQLLISSRSSFSN